MKNISILSESETSAILKLIEQFVITWNSKDVEAFSGVFTDDVEFTDVVGQIARGKKEVKEQHIYPFTVINKIAVVSIDNLYLRAIAKNLVLVSANGTCENRTAPTGEILPVGLSVIQIICKKEDNEWKISLVHNTDISRVYNKDGIAKLRFFAKPDGNKPAL